MATPEENARARRRRWYVRHRDELLAKNREKYRTDGGKKRAQNKAYYEAHREESLARSRERYDRDPEKQRAYARAHYQRNRELRRAQSHAWALAHPELVTAYRRRYTYGITAEVFDQIAAAQNGKCAICGKKKKLEVDHDHKTGAIRGLLCRGCNSGLGQIGDDAPSVRKAIAYLEGRLDLGTSHDAVSDQSGPDLQRGQQGNNKQPAAPPPNSLRGGGDAAGESGQFGPGFVHDQPSPAGN